MVLLHGDVKVIPNPKFSYSQTSHKKCQLSQQLQADWLPAPVQAAVEMHT